MRTSAVALLLALLTATACTAAGPSAAPSASIEPEATEVRIGVLPIVDVAPVYLAIQHGLFADEGLTVTPEIVQGGAAAIPALVAGDLDIAYGNWVSFLLANRQGIELRAVADGVAAAPGFTEFLALPESGMAGEPARMAGATVALNTLSNIGELATRSTLEAAGVDPADVQLVEIPFPEMDAALDRGDVDVIWASEPVPTIVKSSLDAVVVADSFVGEMDAFPVAGYQATASFVEDSPNTLAAFRRAMARAVEMFADDPSIVAGVIPGYTGLTPELAADIALPAYGAELDVATLERVHERLVAFEMIEPGLDVASLVLRERANE